MLRQKVSTLSQVLLAGVLATCLKLLFFPTYRSTDFEVHRNWLAVTHSFPYSEWYFEATSEWTLDYPPFFAWFEKALSQVAVHVDKDMLNVTNINYDSKETIYFQKCSVIFADLLLFYSTFRCCQSLFKSRSTYKMQFGQEAFIVLVIFNAGLLMVDHIHFQYNGFLFGILFLSLYNIMEENIMWGAFWFAVLLNFKHIFLYMAPAYGIFLLRTYCTDPRARGFSLIKSFKIRRLFGLAFIVICVFAASLGPFLDHIDVVFARLFPFKRGLTHAYWAPNFWALYNAADVSLMLLGKRLQLLPANITGSGALTKGLVEESHHVVLPTPTPLATVVVTLLSILPCIVDLWFWPRSLSSKHLSNQFVRCLVFVSLSSFLFGWHVHEKAILMAILPLTILAVRGSRKDTEIFFFLQAVGHYSLFPLLFMPFEMIAKICLVLIYDLYAFSSLQKVSQSELKEGNKPILSTLGTVYLFGLIVCELFCQLHRFIPGLKRYEFLPLMTTSVYCAVGVTWCWIKLFYAINSDRSGYPIEWMDAAKTKDGSPISGKKYYLKSERRKIKKLE